MKTMIAALELVSLAASPTFAASPPAWELHEGRANAYVPYSGGYSGGLDTSTASRWRYFGGPKVEVWPASLPKSPCIPTPCRPADIASMVV
jgi:hypothetical protein